MEATLSLTYQGKRWEFIDGERDAWSKKLIFLRIIILINNSYEYMFEVGQK
jgi:hypothetical protein